MRDIRSPENIAIRERRLTNHAARRRRAEAHRPAAAVITSLPDDPTPERVWLVAAFLLGAIARDTLGDPDAGSRRPVSPPRTPTRYVGALTHSEARVLDYLPTHLSAREIASELCLSVNTIRTHQRHLYQKLGACNRTQAVDLARALGLFASSPHRR